MQEDVLLGFLTVESGTVDLLLKTFGGTSVCEQLQRAVYECSTTDDEPQKAALSRQLGKISRDVLEVSARRTLA